jgi:biopolymer transport protein ExbD
MKPISTMNVIPFIDIMLVLLAVVLTTATFVAQGRIPVALPGAGSAEPLTTLDTVEITVTADGRLFVAERECSAGELAEQLTGLDARTPLLLRVDEGAEFRHFVLVIDLLKARQLNNVSIVTRRS